MSPPTLNVSHSPPVPCTALPPPRYGYYYVEGGSGVSLASVLVYWCQEGYQLVGSEGSPASARRALRPGATPHPSARVRSPRARPGPCAHSQGLSGSRGQRHTLANSGWDVQPPGLPHSDQASEGSSRWGDPATPNRDSEGPARPSRLWSALVKCLLQQGHCNSISGAAEGRGVPEGEFTWDQLSR